MRVALVGFSTPIFYDHKQPPGTPADVATPPNPILDSPMGLFLLFDEIWFLSRDLCPRNMQSLHYVKFMDESGTLPDLRGIEFSEFWEKIKADPTLSARYDRFKASFDVYQQNVKRVGIHWDAATDNHSRSLRLGEISRSGNSINLDNIFFDFEVVRRLNRNNVELITNTFSQRWLDDPNSPIMKARLSELLVIEDIPNYLTPEGPYHPCVDEAREDTFLKDFRRWMAEKTIADEKELADAKREVQQAIARAEHELFLKWLDPKTEYKAIGKTVVGLAADTVPYAPLVIDALEVGAQAKEIVEKRNQRWQAFLVSMKHKALTRESAPQ